jgi:enamine deaminase RidA (YjgF/YER057c/UK114 family)
MPGVIEQRIAELGHTLYGPHPPHDPLVSVVVHGGVARTSGQLPRIDGKLICTGLLGDTVTVEEASRASAVCVLNALSVLREELGTLDRIERVLTLLGFAAVAPGTQMQPAAIDGASRLLFEVFGEAGRHTRSAIGVASLPRGGTVELEVAVAVR